MLRKTTARRTGLGEGGQLLHYLRTIYNRIGSLFEQELKGVQEASKDLNPAFVTWPIAPSSYEHAH